MRVLLPFLLVGCAKTVLPNGQLAPDHFERVETWHGLPPSRTMNATTDVAQLDRALDEARSRGLMLADKGPDLSGEWVQLAMGGDSLNEEHILRRRSSEGVYDSITRFYLYDKDGKALIRADSYGTDVIGSNQYCSFTERIEISFADHETEQTITNIHLLLVPDAMNESGCHPLTAVDKRQLSYENGRGDLMVQTRD